VTTPRTLAIGVVIAGFVALAAAALPTREATIAVGPDDIGGVVTGPNGPEAGVWVIAETNDLPTKFVRIVVTDDQGRYLIPDLPKANYSVWVRGYGLVDSPKSASAIGRTLALKAVPAPNARAAAEIYPAGHWYSLLEVPAKSEFPGTGPQGNGISPNVKSQADFLRTIKSGTCTACHQIGTKGTREIPAMFKSLPTSTAQWERRVQSGQAGAGMLANIGRLGHQRTIRMFADWTDRIAAGEVPPAPRRPQGIERNVVITQWDWADPKAYLHDVVSTDRRKPTVNANGPVYGALEASADYVPVLDPRARPPRITATRRSGRAGPTSTTRCSTRRGACGSPPRSVRSTTHPSASRARRIRRRRCSRSSARSATSPSTTRRRRSSRTSEPASRPIT
jgi:hypothetical protein